MKKFLSSGISFALLLSFGAFFLVPSNALAATTASLSATTPGYISNWSVSGTGLVGGDCSSDYIASATTNQRSAFTVNLSSIPDGSTITSVAVSATDRETSGSNGTYRTFARLNGVNTDAGSDLAASSGFGCTSRGPQTLDVTDTIKVSGGTPTTLEIGVFKTSGDTSGVRIGSVSVVITYTAPPTTTVGDGTTPSNKTVVPSATNRGVSTFTLSTNTGTDTVTNLTVTGTNTGNVTASGVKVYQDNGTTANEWDASDTLKGTSSFSGTTATFTGINLPVTTTSTQYLVTYDISATPTNAQTLTGVVSSITATNVVTNNDTTDATLTIDSAAPSIVEFTPVPAFTSVNTPAYTFNSSEAGTITYGGDCASATTAAVAGNTTVNFNILANGLHNNCTVKVTDAVGNQSNVIAVSPFTVDVGVAPSGGAITYTDGVYGAFSVPMTYTLGSDALSGINAASGRIQRRSAPLSGGTTCGGFGSFSTLVTESDGSHTDTTVANNTCYQYQYQISDNAGNQATYFNAAQTAKIFVTHTITASADPEGSISPAGSVVVSQGSNQTFSIAPSIGFIVSNVFVDTVAQSTINSFTFSNVTAPHTITASFDGGWSAPSSTGNDGGVASPTNAFVSDEQNAVFNAGTDVIDFRNFNLSIPAGATINGIRVSVEGKRDSGGTPRTFDTNISWNNGTNLATAKTGTDLGTSEKTVVLGSVNDTWGSHVWTPAEFNNGAFMVRIDPIVATGNLNIDQIQVKVSYTPDTTFPVITVVNANTAPAQSKTVTASTNEGTLTKSVTSGSVCDGSLTFSAYSSTTFTTEADNGKKICYRAIDVAGNTTYTMSDAIAGIDLTPPVTVVDSAADGAGPINSGDVTNSTSITVNFSATDASDIALSECKLDGGAYAPCTTPYTNNAITDGAHTVSIRSTDNAGNLESTATFSWTVDTDAPVITLTGTTPISVVYGVGYTDEGASALDALDGAVTVFTTGDTVTPTSPVGVYTIFYNASDAAGNNAAQVTRTITVTAKEVAVTADAKSKTFGDTDPALTYVGVLNGSDTFSGALTRVPGEDVGTYAITQGTLSAGSNYTITFTGADLTIGSRAITATADVQSKIYGASDPTLTYQVTSGVLQGGDTFSGSLIREVGESVGSYAITQGDLSLSSNYALTVVPSTLTIGQKDIHVTAAAKTKVYGAVDPALTYSSDELVGSDTFSGELTRAPGEMVGTHVITQGTLALSEDYNLIFTGADLTITPAILTVTASSDTFVYGGAVPAITASYSGFVNGDTLPDTLPTCSTTATSISPVGSYPSSCVGAVDGDYTISYVDGSVSVTQASLSVSAEDMSKVYGAENPTFTGTIVGVLNGDDVVASYTSSATAASPIGTYAIVPELTGTSLSNYSAPVITNGTLTVTKAPISVVADDATRVYGDANPTFTGSITGILNGDAVTASYSTTADETSVVGTYAIVPLLSGAALSNYDTPSTTNGTLTVTNRAITVTADAGQTKVYGEAEPILTYTVTTGTLASGDAFTGELARGSNENVGTYPITQGTLALPSDYTLTFVGDDFEVTKRPITVTAQTNTKVYDSTTSAVAVPTITLGTLAFSDTANFTESYDNKNVGTGKTLIPAGSVTDGNSGANYQVTFVNDTTGEITAPATLTISGVVANDKVYDASTTATLDTSGAALVGIVSGDDVALDATGASATFADKHVGTDKPVTTSGFVLTGLDAANYGLTQPALDADITQKTLAVTATASNKAYDGNTTASVTLSDDRIIGDVFTVSNVAADFDTAAIGTGKEVTVTGIAITGEDAGNYSANTSTTATADIASIELTVTATGSNKVYDGTDAATVTLEVTGEAGTDEIAATGTATYSDKNVGDGKTISVTGITLSGTNAENYTFNDTTSAVGDITKKDITASAAADNKVYDGTTDAVGHVTLSDTVALDDVSSTNVATFADAVAGVGKVVSVAVTLTGADALNYNLANSPVATTADITAATGSVVITGTAQAYDGTPKFVTTETTPSGLTADVTYDLSATAPTNAGSYAVVATINDANYTGTASDTLVIAKAANTITFADPADVNFGIADFAVAATASSLDAVTFTATGNCTITPDGSVVHLTGAGSCEVTAHEDGNDNYEAASDVMQSFTVTDANGPVIVGTPLDMTVEATSGAGAVVTYTDPSATDDVDGPVAVACVPASGTTFAIATTLVTCTATDSALNASNTTFNVTVEDTTAPVLTLVGSTPETIEVGGSYTEQGATTADTVDGAGVAVVGGDAVNTAVVGAYVVSYSKTDAAGNVATPVTRTVNVVDTSAPVITIDPYTTTLTNLDVVVTASTNEGTLNTVAHTFTANGSFDFVATDASGNAATSTVTITNIDKEAPVITLTGSTPVEVTIGDSYVDAGATATDNVDVSVTVNTAGTVDTGTLGAYVLTYSASDTAGNAATEVTRTVNVVDLPAPVITAETAASATETTVTITWTTDHPATSRVVLDTVSHDPAGIAPNYGYASTTPEIGTLVTSHSVTVTGLTPGTTYYFRAVSHGSPESTSNEIVQMTDDVPPPVDVCSNIEGAQAVIPEGMHDEDGACVLDEEEPADVCPNIDGTQESLPEGYELVEGQCVLIDTPPTEIVNSCPLPDSLSDVTVETVKMNTGNELNLQGILDDAGNNLDVVDDQKQYQVWHVTEGSSFTIAAQHIDNVAGLTSVFGYYMNGDMGSFVPLFKTAAVAGLEAVPLATGGQVTVNVPSSGTLAFAIKVYNENTLVGTYASQNALNSGNADQMVAYNTSSNTYALGFEDTLGGDRDFNDLVVEVFLNCVQMCTLQDVQQTVVSDTLTLSDNNPTTLLSFIHSAWTAAIPGASWIWSEEPIADAQATTTKTFTREFTIVGTPVDSTLAIAADNSYSVTVNGHPVCTDVTESNFTLAGQDTCVVHAADLLEGVNSMVFTVTNWQQNGGTPTSNPAGLTYKLTLNSKSCEVPPTPIDLCANIDGVQAQVPEGYQASGDQCTLIQGGGDEEEGGDNEPPAIPQCSNGLDDDNDGLKDTQDPGCYSNQNPNDSGSYDPNDDNETHVPESSSPASSSNGGGGGGGNGPILGSFGGGTGQVLGAATSILPELPASCTALLHTYMRMGKQNDVDEVKKLQNFLNTYMGTTIEVDGVFGKSTDSAVRAFQVKHTPQVLNPWRITYSTGYVYKTTQRWINLQHCSTLEIPMPDLN